MRRIMLSMVAILFAFSAPALGQPLQPGFQRAPEPDIGGHYRHSHRDWSQQEGRHVHNVCWDWDPGQGWVWICR